MASCQAQDIQMLTVTTFRNRDVNFITKDCARYHAIYNNVYKLADSGRFAWGLQISIGLQKNHKKMGKVDSSSESQLPST